MTTQFIETEQINYQTEQINCQKEQINCQKEQINCQKEQINCQLVKHDTSIKSKFDKVLIIQPEVFEDSRGFFLETWQKHRYQIGGVDVEFIQDNHSRSKKGVIRGLHYQLKHPQAKLVYVVRGTIFDVAVDIRKGSPTFGKWTGAILSDENRHQFFIPAGFAHGFSVLSDIADVIYKCSDVYTPGDEYGIIYNDHDLNIDWHLNIGVSFTEMSLTNLSIQILVSGKDGHYPELKDIPDSNLFAYI